MRLKRVYIDRANPNSLRHEITGGRRALIDLSIASADHLGWCIRSRADAKPDASLKTSLKRETVTSESTCLGRGARI